MKKICKISFLLAMTALLAGCNNKPIVDKPNFEGYKSKVTDKTFYDAFTKQSQKNAILGNFELPSFELSSTSVLHIEETNSRKGDAKEMIYTHLITDSSLDVVALFDSDHYLFDYLGVESISNNHKYYNNEQVLENVEKTTKGFKLEVETIDGTEMICMYNKILKTKSPTEHKEVEMEDIVSQITNTSLLVDARFLNETRWESLDKDLLKRYTFYHDKDVFTIVYEYSLLEEELNDDNLITRKTTTSSNRIFQFVINDKAVKYFDYFKQNSKIETYTYFDNYITIDTSEYSELKATSSILTVKDNVVLPDDDTSSYRSSMETIAGSYFTPLS